MIIKTKIDWVQRKKLSQEESEKIEARKEFDETYDSYEEEYEEIEKNAIIDTFNDKLYIEVEDKKVCLVKLLGGEYVMNHDGKTERIEERLYIKNSLEEIYNLLINNQ